MGVDGGDEDCGVLPWELEPNAEFEPENAAGQISVQGRLRTHSKFWLEELEPSSFVNEIVTHGYRIPFIRLPDPFFYRNHRSPLKHAE